MARCDCASFGSATPLPNLPAVSQSQARKKDDELGLVELYVHCQAWFRANPSGMELVQPLHSIAQPLRG